MDEIMQLAKQVAVLEERSASQEKAFIKLETRIEECLHEFKKMFEIQGDRLHKFDLRLWIIIFILATASGGASSIFIKLLG